jgi:mRNA interferase RelE/StbE
VSRYALFLDPEVHRARRDLPGAVRQRLRQAFDDLALEPRPPRTQPLDVTDLEVPAGIELRRLRLERWRVIYAVSDAEAWAWVLAVRQRPPYDYEDLAELAARLPE